MTFRGLLLLLSQYLQMQKLKCMWISNFWRVTQLSRGNKDSSTNHLFLCLPYFSLIYCLVLLCWESWGWALVYSFPQYMLGNANSVIWVDPEVFIKRPVYRAVDGSFLHLSERDLYSFKIFSTVLSIYWRLLGYVRWRTFVPPLHKYNMDEKRFLSGMKTKPELGGTWTFLIMFLQSPRLSDASMFYNVVYVFQTNDFSAHVWIFAKPGNSSSDHCAR